MILEYDIATRRVWSSYDDGTGVTARPGAALMSYAGDLDALDRFGDLPEDYPEGAPDYRPHRAPAPDMPALRQVAFERAMAFGNGITARVVGAYSDVEARTWPLQRAQADTVLAGKDLPPDALLTKLAARRGVAIEAFALIVQHKAQAFESIADVGQGLRLGAEGLLSTDLDTPEKLAAAVEALRAQTLTAATELGLVV